MILRERAALLVSALFVGCAAATASRQGPVAIPLAPPPRPVPELVEQLGAPDAPSRAAAAWALAGAGEVDEATSEALFSRLEDPSEPVREAATWALSHVRGSGVAKGNLMDAPPKLLVQTRPRYPIDAFRRGVHGTVIMNVLISAIGRVIHVEIRQSVPGLDEAALECVRQWQFEAATRAGRPVASVAQVPVTFTIGP